MITFSDGPISGSISTDVTSMIVYMVSVFLVVRDTGDGEGFVTEVEEREVNFLGVICFLSI